MSGASELVEGREVFDPFLNKTVKVSDKLTDRLRGRYAIGPTMDNGEPEFGWREFTTPPIQHEAADELARLSSAHSEAVEDARKHLAELSASRAEVVGLREALAFYRDQWRTNSDGDIGGESHLIRSWQEPTEELWDDAGQRARVALAGEKPVGAGVETLATDYLRGKIGEIIALQLDIEGGRAVEQAVEQILAVAALSKSGEKP